jgi:hypothetical protein
MAAFTSVAKVVSIPAPAGGDGLKLAMGTCVGTASYDTGGSVIDLSGVFGSKVYYLEVNSDVAAVRFAWVPGTAYASSDGKLFADDNAGTEQVSTTDLHTTCAVIEWIALGTDD